MSETPAWQLTASQAKEAFEGGVLTPQAYAASLFERIDARDDTVKGWAAPIDRARVAADMAAAKPGLLQGIPVAIKDVIDVAGMPTQHGTTFWDDAPLAKDSGCAARLRAAGAVLMGKAVTAEFATYNPGPTTNPHNAAHTPGGSSSGSAALVADGQVPLALGTQTAGSVIRPASYNGILGFKPSHGRYPEDGVLDTAPSLDTVGVFARSLEDIVLIDAVLADCPPATLIGEKPRIGICPSPAWPHADKDMRDTFHLFAAQLETAGFKTLQIKLPKPFPDLLAAQALIHRYEASQVMGHIRCDHSGEVSEAFRSFIDAGAAESEVDYKEALACQAACKAKMDSVFEGVDLLLVPGATGAAPKGLDATGDPIFQRIWTAVGAPSLGFPAAWNANGLPLGLQVVARPGADAQCLGHAAHIMPHVHFKQE